MTDNEIIKALKSEIHLAKYVDSSYCDCVKVSLLEAILDLINRYRAEMKRLNNEVFVVEKHLETARAEAVKEFVDKLKEKSFKVIRNYGLTKDVVEVCDIDNLVKEMTEQRKEDEGK